MPPFTFEIAQAVRIARSGELGSIVGQAAYSFMQEQYLVRYTAADGRACDGWFCADELSSVDGVVSDQPLKPTSRDLATDRAARAGAEEPAPLPLQPITAHVFSRFEILELAWKIAGKQQVTEQQLLGSVERLEAWINGKAAAATGSKPKPTPPTVRPG